MRNQIFSVMALAVTMLLASGCENPVTSATDNPAEQQEEVKYKTISFNITGFEVTTEDITTTRADKKLSDFNLKGLTLTVLKQNGDEWEVVRSIKQSSTSTESFGSISCSVPYGSYTVVAVATAGEQLYDIASATSVSYPTGEDRVPDTFCDVISDLEVFAESGTDVSMQLERVVGAVGIKLEETSFPDEFAYLTIEISGGASSFNPSTGYGTDTKTFSRKITKADYSNKNTMGLYVFVPQDVSGATLTVKAFDSGDNLLKTKVVDDVPLEVKNMVKYTGYLFGNKEDFSITVDGGETSISTEANTKEYIF